jgi:hypothetical protein
MWCDRTKNASKSVSTAQMGERFCKGASQEVTGEVFNPSSYMPSNEAELYPDMDCWFARFRSCVRHWRGEGGEIGRNMAVPSPKLHVPMANFLTTVQTSTPSDRHGLLSMVDT